MQLIACDERSCARSKLLSSGARRLLARLGPPGMSAFAPLLGAEWTSVSGPTSAHSYVNRQQQKWRLYDPSRPKSGGSMTRKWRLYDPISGGSMTRQKLQKYLRRRENL